jgi:hypothetical protein
MESPWPDTNESWAIRPESLAKRIRTTKPRRSAGAVTPSIVYWKNRNVSETATAAVATSSRPRRNTNPPTRRR